MRIILLISFIINSVGAQVLLRNGEYLSSEYINILRTTHSPDSASSATQPYVAVVKFLADSSFDVVLGDFTEATTSLSFKKGEFVGLTPNWPDHSIESIKLESPTQFVINGLYTFNYINDSQLWLKSTLFIGEYKDSLGHKYRFTDKYFYL